MKMINTAENKQSMLLDIQRLSFVLVDLNLFLDINPDCQEAIADFNQVFAQYWEIRGNYEMHYGPLANFGHCPANYPWSWVNDPWPWERKSC